MPRQTSYQSHEAAEQFVDRRTASFSWVKVGKAKLIANPARVSIKYIFIVSSRPAACSWSDEQRPKATLAVGRKLIEILTGQKLKLNPPCALTILSHREGRQAEASRLHPPAQIGHT